MPKKNTFFIYNLLSCLLFLLVACSAPIEVKWLEGYWQIEKVTQAGESFTPAVGNIQYDYYTRTSADKGYRKKVSPSFGGNLTTSRDQSNFELTKKEKSWVLSFDTAWDQWDEKIITLDSLQLVLEHNNKRYFYKRQYPTDE